MHLGMEVLFCSVLCIVYFMEYVNLKTCLLQFEDIISIIYLVILFVFSVCSFRVSYQLDVAIPRFCLYYILGSHFLFQVLGYLLIIQIFIAFFILVIMFLISKRSFLFLDCFLFFMATFFKDRIIFLGVSGTTNQYFLQNSPLCPGFYVLPAQVVLFLSCMCLCVCSWFPSPSWPSLVAGVDSLLQCLQVCFPGGSPSSWES